MTAGDPGSARADRRGQAGPPQDLQMQVVDPGSDEARAVLTAYFRDIVSRGRGRDATDAEVAAAMSAEPSDDLRPPGGLLLLARHDGGVAGCAGLRLLPGGIAELTRMFVLPHARRRGIGQLLVEAVETAAREHQVSTLRLDTSDHLTEARHLYARNGYQEVEPFNDGRFANLWYQKTLT